jgi:glutamine amidotransferase PdxT
LLAERCVGTSAVITKGQSLIGGVDILVCRNYFGSQISSFEMNTPPPPPSSSNPPCCGNNRSNFLDNKDDGTQSDNNNNNNNNAPFPGVFIRAPAILNAGPDVQILGKVVAAPCRAAAVVLRELEIKIASGENVIQMGVVDALERKAGGGITYSDVRLVHNHKEKENQNITTTKTTNAIMPGPSQEKNKTNITTGSSECIALPGASDESNAREVICAVQKGNILCTAFHPEIADDLRWHEYFLGMVLNAKKQREQDCV